MWKKKLEVRLSVSFDMASGYSPKVMWQTEDRAASAFTEQWYSNKN